MLNRVGFLMVIIIGLLLVGACGSDDPTPTATPRATPTSVVITTTVEVTPTPVPKPDFKGITLVGYTPAGGKWRDGKELFADRFNSETGGKVELIRMGATDRVGRIIAERDNPQADFTITSATDVLQVLIDANSLVPIEWAKVPNADNLFGPVQKLAMESYGGYFSPNSKSEQGIMYRADLLNENNVDAPTKLEDLWDPAYKGKVALMATFQSAPWMMMEGIASIRCGDSKDIACGFEEFKKLKTDGQICGIAESIQQFNQLMSDGTCWVGFATIFRFYNVEAAGFDIKFTLPQDYKAVESPLGIVAIRKTSDRQWDALMYFVNMLADPELQADVAMFKRYSIVNADSRPFLTIDYLLQGKLTTEDQWNGVLFYDWQNIATFRESITQRFNQEILR